MWGCICKVKCYSWDISVVLDYLFCMKKFLFCALFFVLVWCSENIMKLAPIQSVARDGEIVSVSIETGSVTTWDVTSARQKIAEAIIYDQSATPHASWWKNTLTIGESAIFVGRQETDDALIAWDDVLYVWDDIEFVLPYNTQNRETLARAECQWATSDDVLCQISSFAGFVSVDETRFLVLVERWKMMTPWLYSLETGELTMRDDIEGVYKNDLITRRDEVLSVGIEQLAWWDDSDWDVFVAPEWVYIQQLDIQTDLSDVIVLPKRTQRTKLDIGQIASFVEINGMMYVWYTKILYAEETQQDYIAAYDSISQKLLWRAAVTID